MGLLKVKVIALVLLSTTLVSNAFAEAEIAFDLHAQHFSKSIEGLHEGARYELPKAFVTTNLKYIDGTYITKADYAGILNVEVKEPIADWSISVDAFYILGSQHDQTRTIKVTSENGESILVSFKFDKVTFNGTTVYQPGEYQRITTAITQNGDDIDLVINGAIAGSASRATFGKLKYVDVQAINEYDNSDYNNNNDYINGLTIGSK